MKKLFLCAVGLMGTLQAGTAESGFNNEFRKDRVGLDRLSQGRSLKDILAQHGGQLKPGKTILTVDGILEDETPAAAKVAKLQHRVAAFKVANDPRVSEVLVSLAQAAGELKAVALLDYIEEAYGKERSPLFSFVAQVVHEKNEVLEINTEALRLMSEKNCRAGASEVMQQLSGYNTILIAVESALEALWKEITAVVPEVVRAARK